MIFWKGKEGRDEEGESERGVLSKGMNLELGCVVLSIFN